jgi:hypothetical protein
MRDKRDFRDETNNEHYLKKLNSSVMSITTPFVGKTIDVKFSKIIIPISVESE